MVTDAIKARAVIDGHASIDSSWTEQDFAELAIAAADQAGLSARDQEWLRAMLSMPAKTVAALETLRNCGAL
jgi:hypothetical protein